MLYWTLGRYDIVLILEAQDDAVAAELGLNLGRLGNVRTRNNAGFWANRSDQATRQDRLTIAPV